MMSWINHGLAAVLVNEWAVPTIVVAFALGCVFILWWNYDHHYRGMKAASTERLRALRPVLDADGIDEAQARFAADFQAIDDAMRARDGSPVLVHAWLEYNETIVDPNATPVQATARPDEYFLHLGDDTRVIAWWANLYVAFGLTFTFLGIIAALTATTDSLRGADTNHMSSALITLLTLTAAKFWTSIAGVVGSIVLRYVDRRWHSHTTRRLDEVARGIERGTCFMPAQRVAVDQLHELREQSTALREFSSQLAVGIADALGEKMQPVVVGLAGIQSSIDDFKSGSFDQIGKELGTAISQGAGTEMASLAAALTAMTEGIRGVNDRLEGASGEAGDQIAAAAREFSTASEQMTRAFATLNERIEGMAAQLGAQSDAARQAADARVAEDRASYEVMATGQRDVMRAMGEELRAASAASTTAMVEAVQEAVRGAMAESGIAIRGALDGFAGATSGIQTAFDQMRGQIADLGNALSGSANEAADRNGEVLTRAAAALEAATGRASQGMGAAIEQAITRSAEESGRAIATAFAAFGEKFDAASATLTDTLRTTAGRMETLAGAIERSTGAAADHAGKLADAGREAQGVATMLGRAANDVSSAAGPIREATGTIGTAVGRTQEMLRAMDERGAQHETAIRTIATSLSDTGDAATRAWTSYRDRFEGVDDALAAALDRIKGATAEHATALNDQVGRIDTALAKSIDRLSAALDTIADLAATLEDARRH